GRTVIVVTNPQYAVLEVLVERFRVALFVDDIKVDVRRAARAVLGVDHASAHNLVLGGIDEDEQVLALEGIERACKRLLRLRDEPLEHAAVVGQVHGIEVLRNLVNLVEIFRIRFPEEEHLAAFFYRSWPVAASLGRGAPGLSSTLGSRILMSGCLSNH